LGSRIVVTLFSIYSVGQCLLCFTEFFEGNLLNEEAPSWGIAISHEGGFDDRGLNNYYHTNGGSGVDVYILDTGMWVF